ncbi:zinc finger protein 181-like [Chrysoperla carnea]|uniref:zinc finger protein 181-like n=1 Tax=Chrysoperla carnea TaxID=189513 RepID=UPI001D065D44|nr:zinc finger protein 181-like [Chrysoperla carnea]
MEDGVHYLMEEEILNNSIKSVKQEPTYEKTQHLYAINYENIKLEAESSTEVIKSETFDDEITMEVGRIKNETPEEGSNDINSVITFAQKGTLDQHKRIHREEKAHSCEICSKRFYRPSELVRHKRVHSGEKPFPCEICNKAFTQKDIARA